MNEIINQDKLNIKDMIYNIDGVEVMLDSDLAKLYNVETKRINEAVKNNPDKFPSRYSWVINPEEANEFLRSKFSTLEIDNRTKHFKHGVRVFTEQGIYMLATILKSKEATQVSIRIMDTFVKMRHYINYTKEFLPYKVLLLEDKIDNIQKDVDKLFDMFDPKVIVKDKMFYEGEFYDAYSFLMNILNMAKKEIIIIDNYASKEILDAVKNIDKKVIIASRNITDESIKKYKKQYSNVDFICNKSIHDRYIIIDRKRMFISGASFKDLGKKCSYMCEAPSLDDLKGILSQLEL
ncbi:MAG: ORF6N domain-containing protein [Bacilli bacterium]|nr:ORF6N domain-containing protein [Bacilli bacterium]